MFVKSLFLFALCSPLAFASIDGKSNIDPAADLPLLLESQTLDDMSNPEAVDSSSVDPYTYESADDQSLFEELELYGAQDEFSPDYEEATDPAHAMQLFMDSEGDPSDPDHFESYEDQESYEDLDSIDPYAE